jgi:heme-degrading monooxygenase HmoA
MIAVIFEVEPFRGKEAMYFDIAADLRENLEKMDGFISVERFQSLTRTGVFLSLSYWRDEAAVRLWRNQAEHRSGQRTGRSEVFADYRIRIASVVRDYSKNDRNEAPRDSNDALVGAKQA